MKERRRGCLGGGCLLFVSGIVAGIALTILIQVGWGMVRSVDLSPLSNRLMPGGSDLEVTMSEAFLNQAVAQELAKHNLEGLTRVVVDTQPGWELQATLEGYLNLGGILPPTPKVDAEVGLGLDRGRLVVRIERIGVGPVRVVRDSLPKVVQPLFEGAEEALERAINEPIQTQGYQVREVRTDDGSLTLGLGEP